MNQRQTLSKNPDGSVDEYSEYEAEIPYTKFSLIADRDTYKTGPLVHDHGGDACYDGEQNHDNDDYMEGMRKQAASGPQGVGDRPSGNDPCHHWDRNENEGDEQTGDIKLFRVRTVEQTLHRYPTKVIQQKDYYGRQEKDNANHQGRLGFCEESVSLCGKGIRHIMVPCPPGLHNRKQDEADGKQVKPQEEKQHEGEILIEISPVDDFHDHERKDEEQTKERW